MNKEGQVVLSTKHYGYLHLPLDESSYRIMTQEKSTETCGYHVWDVKPVGKTPNPLLHKWYENVRGNLQ